MVTNVSDLSAGDQIVIVAKDSDYAMSTVQNNNNRGQVAVTKGEGTVTAGNDVQVLTLEVGTKDGTLAFNTGSGYLYAASSSNNYLRTEETLSDNSSWTIEIADDGTATIVAQGNYTRNVMQYNQSSSLFACYASATQKAICIYKLAGSGEPACEHASTTTTTVDATCTVAGSTTVVCDSCGATVSETPIPAGHTFD